MFQDVSSFLKRFHGLKPPERYIQEYVIEVVKSALGITLRRAEVSVRGKTIYINTTPVAKSEIVLHKSEILQTLSQKPLAAHTIHDIR